MYTAPIITNCHNRLQVETKKRIIRIAVLGGEVAVPYNLQSAIARLNSHLRWAALWSALRN